MRLARSDIDVWTVALDRDAGPDCLTASERARAEAAVDAGERRRRVRARSALRRILAAYVGVPPAELGLLTGAYGKPCLAGGPDFNLSHSGERMMLAVSSAGPVGIDLEQAGRLDGDWAQVTGRALSERERAQLLALGEDERPRASLRGWVRKEAYAKARGAGFAYGFTAFTVDLAADIGVSGLIEDAHDADAPAVWRLCDLVAPADFAASLAHAGQGGEVRYRSIEELGP